VVGDPPAAATPHGGYSDLIARDPETRGEAFESERLARRYFAVVAQRELGRLHDLLHPDVEIVLKTSPTGEVLRGRKDVVAYVGGEVAGRFHEAHADVFRPFDDERIVVEGRMRWMDDERVLRDDPVVWALEFRDGLLRRSTPAVTVLEAETLLAVSTG